jgi:molybdate transport system ATP-binding protein
MRLMTDDVMLMENGRIQQRLDAGELARKMSGASPAGYCNVLSIRHGQAFEGMWRYQWGGQSLFLTQAPAAEEHIGMLSAKDVVLFREHPKAVSARNLLPVKVRDLIFGPATCQVVLDCAGESLTAEVVHAAVSELNLAKEKPVYAAIKASAFRLLS